VFDAVVRILGTQLASALGPRIAPRAAGSEAIREAPSTSWLGGARDAPAVWSGGASPAASSHAVTSVGAPFAVPGAEPAVGPLLAREALPPEPSANLFAGATFIAQIRRLFLLCETSEGLLFLDQHAAAERVTFDRLRRAYASREVASQRLLVPEIVRVTAAEAALVEEAAEAIAASGLEVRPAGSDAVAVHAVPQLLLRAPPASLVRDLLVELGRAGGRAWSGAIDLALATMACHGSVRAGDEVSGDEARALLADLAEVDFAGHCPHGRPIVHRLGWPELYARVGR